MNIKYIKRIVEESFLVIIIFLFFIFTSFIYVSSQKDNNINSFLVSLKQLYATQYFTVYDNFNKLSQNSFYGIVNKPEIYNLVKYAYKNDEVTQNLFRQRLYEKLISDYNRLRDFKFHQVHFHFPDNTSFLRMHKPDKFGDDLSDDRFSIAEVNKNLKPIHGYEIGKIVDGFRFVYPLFDEELLHIGSVELSVSSDFFEKNFESNFDVDTHFLIKKSIAQRKIFPEFLKQYRVSNENNEYLYREDSAKELTHYTNENFYTKEEKENISQRMENSETFSIYKEIDGRYMVISFLPVNNVENERNAAYMVLYKNSDYIEQIFNNYHKMLFILFLISLIFTFYISFRHKRIEEVRNREYLLSQQTKMAALGEMIQNISHQWRQPLSIISVLASGLKLKKECNILEDKELYENLDGIIENTNYLSNTIEDFRNYFDESSQKKVFNLKDMIEQSISMFRDDLNAKNILIVDDIDDIEICTYESELKQVIINLLKNAKEFTKKGVIIINAHEKKNEIVIEILDSAGGIPKNIIKKIFEPYFTTKHSSLGVGLGLYSAHEIITKKLKGTISVENKQFDYSFDSYTGACFKITINRKYL